MSHQTHSSQIPTDSDSLMLLGNYLIRKAKEYEQCKTDKGYEIITAKIK